MKNIILEAQKRDIFGKKTKTLRKQGFIPAVIYGHETKTIPLQVKLSDFSKVFDQAGTSALIDLKIEEEKPRKVLINEPQVHPLTGLPLHIDFHQVKMTEKIKTEVPIKIIGTSKAVEEQDGNLITNKDAISIECLPSELIHQIEVDITPLQNFEDIIQVKDLHVPKEISILNDLDEIVISVTPPRTEEELEELESIRAYDTAKASDDKVVPFEQAIAEIEKSRK